MRLLYVPVLNYPNNIQADSIYMISRDWCRHMCDAHPDLAIYFLHPELSNEDRREQLQKKLDKREKIDPLYRFYGYYKKCHQRVYDFFVPMIAKFDLEETNIDPDVYRQFHPIMGDKPVDAVVVTSSIKLMGVKRQLMAGAYGDNSPAFFNFELLLRGAGSNEVATVNPDEMALQAVGETMGYNLWESPKCKSIATRNAARYLSIAGRRLIEESGSMVYSGFDHTQVQPIAQEGKFEEFTTIIRGRLTGSKNVDKILDVYSRFYSSGREVSLLVTTGDVRHHYPALDKALQKNQSITVRRIARKEEANAVMRRAHAFLIWSSHELFCVSVWEMLAAGLIGIFKKEDWQKGLLPDAYPYIFDGTSKECEKKAFTMLCDVMDNYEQRCEELAWVRDYVVDKFAYMNTAKIAGDVIKDKIRTDPLIPRPWIRDIIAEHGWNEMTPLRSRDLAINNSKQGDTLLYTNAPHRMQRCVGPNEVHVCMQQVGYVDTLEVEPRYLLENKGKCSELYPLTKKRIPVTRGSQLNSMVDVKRRKMEP